MALLNCRKSLFMKMFKTTDMQILKIFREQLQSKVRRRLIARGELYHCLILLMMLVRRSLSI